MQKRDVDAATEANPELKNSKHAEKSWRVNSWNMLEQQREQFSRCTPNMS